jgi:hypothetical protein
VSEKPNKQMRGVNRRHALQGILGGTVVVTMGLIVPPKVVEAVPLTQLKMRSQSQGSSAAQTAWSRRRRLL